ncbi:MAG: transcriptional repressor LexA [Eubacteriales bacterium]|jgi:repressor LexA
MEQSALTKTQRAIYDYIVQITKEQGFPPSVREIGDAVGLKSPSTVHMHLKKLNALGIIDRQERKTRAIRLEGVREKSPTGVRSIPVIGRAAAGSPVLAVTDIEGYIPYDVGHSQGDFFALRIRGDSMIDAGILDGDYVVIRRQEAAVHRDIVLAAIDGEVTVKRFYRQRGEVWLMPENPEYSPISAKDASVVGKVVGLYRKY